MGTSWVPGARTIESGPAPLVEPKNAKYSSPRSQWLIGSSQPLPSDGRYAFIDQGLPWRSPRICFGSKGNKEDKRQEGQRTDRPGITTEAGLGRRNIARCCHLVVNVDIYRDLVGETI